MTYRHHPYHLVTNISTCTIPCVLRALPSERQAASLTAEDPLQALLIKDVLEGRVQGL